MRGKPTQQAQNAINDLMAAGLSRRDFKVTTERLRGGIWGDARIWIRNLQRASQVAEAIAGQGYNVCKYYSQGLLLSVIVTSARGKSGSVTYRTFS